MPGPGSAACSWCAPAPRFRSTTPRGSATTPDDRVVVGSVHADPDAVALPVGDDVLDQVILALGVEAPLDALARGVAMRAPLGEIQADDTPEVLVHGELERVPRAVADGREPRPAQVHLRGARLGQPERARAADVAQARGAPRGCSTTRSASISRRSGRTSTALGIHQPLVEHADQRRERRREARRAAQASGSQSVASRSPRGLDREQLLVLPRAHDQGMIGGDAQPAAHLRAQLDHLAVVLRAG